jgi:3-dehydroquinate dehydratase/shikimate dehydrogenase
MIAKIKLAEPLADVIEVRFDCLPKKEISSMMANLPAISKTYLVTFRSKEQGGKRELPIREQIKFWELVFYHHKTNFMIDVEADARMMLAIEPNKIKRIISLHNFDDTPRDFGHTFDVLSNVGGPITKLAFYANDIGDSVEVWKLLERATNANKQFIPIAMGEAGKWTRILGLAHGAYMTYASLDEGEETADGQITAKDMIEVYRVKELDENTRVYGVIGDPVSSSKSPYMHNAAFAFEAMNAVFLPLLVKNLDEFILRIVRRETREVELNFAGFSVTMPHKEAIINHLDDIDDTAKKIGAVNTVKIERDKLVGYNTDAHGFITPLKEKFGDLKNARVAVLGAGGAARACVYALSQKGADVTVFARDSKKANSFVEEFNINAKLFPSVGSDKSLVDTFDILVNATPFGMKGDLENESPLTAEQLAGVKFVYDLVTRPDHSPLVGEAKKAGIPVIGGLEMLIAQGVKQFEIWTGRDAPADVMRQSVMSRLTKNS